MNSYTQRLLCALRPHLASSPVSGTRSALALLFLAVLLLFPTSASAQTAGFAINRFEPSERGSDWFANESLDLRGDSRWAVGAVLDWAHKPLVAYDAAGEEQAAILEDQFHAHLGGAVVFADRVRIGVNVPVLLVSGGDSATSALGTIQTEGGAAFGDVRLGGDVRLFGIYGEAATLGAGLHLHLPTGSRDAFTSDGRVRIVPRVVLSGDIDNIAYSVRTGINVRTQGEDFAGQPFGSEWQFGGAVGLRLLDKALLLGPELYGSTVLSDRGDGFFDREASPLEAVMGAHLKVGGGFQVGLGAGPGLNRGLGSPALRVLGVIEWFAEPEVVQAPPKDSDGDGIIDEEDACIDVPGVPNEDQAKHGCPEEVKRKDSDGDGIFDDEDACVEHPGEPSEDPNLNGCPPPDTDGDGILDADDACVSDPGKPSENPKKHGCPKAKIEGKQVKILERIEFDSAKATLRPESNEVLQAVLEILTAHPELRKLSIEGHTDNRGARAFNTNLSRKRAEAVRLWLIDHGIEAGRLSAAGFGPDKPIEDNDSDEGRQNNRRVEFHITEQDSSSTEIEESP